MGSGCPALNARRDTDAGGDGIMTGEGKDLAADVAGTLSFIY